VGPGTTELGAELARGLGVLGLPDDAVAVGRWLKLAVLLDRWSQRLNLTGHRGAREIAKRLLLEAAALSQVLPEASTIADLGSGAGVPGLPLAICRPDYVVRLVESRARRHHFQRAAVRELGLANALPLLGRAEELEVVPSDGVIAQAMATPELALAWMLRWALPGGWVALATVPARADRLQHPDLDSGQALRYAAPGGPERAVWLARLRAEPAA
jgi:16S rRNA (guanine527-N7)-methyltransferase